MDLHVLFPRYYECPTGKQWYVCTKGNYAGCCSSDPCTTGICPDGSSTPPRSSFPPLEPLPTSSSASEMSSSTTSSEITPTSSVTTTSMSSPFTTTTITSSTTTGTTSSSLAASHTTTPASAGSKSSSNAALIGGVVGGVIGALFVAALLWFCWRRRRREHAFNIVSLHRSVSSQSLNEQKTTSPVKPSPNPSGGNRHFSRNTDSLALSTTGSHANTTISAPDSWSLNIPGLTNGPSEASTLSSRMTTNRPLQNTNNTSDLPPIPQSSELPAPLPRGAGFTPELPDTTVHRPRAELAPNPQSELINVPMSERMRLSAQSIRPGPGPGFQPASSSRSWDSPSTSASTNPSPYPSPSTTAATSTTSPAMMSRSTAPRIVTDDGVVLGANLDRYSVPAGLDGGHGVDGGGGRRERNAQDHVMSFMEFGGEGVGGRRSSGEAYARAVSSGRAARADAILEEDSFSPASDVPPAYESEGFSPRDKKSPSATMGLGLRGMERE